jgi:hypothetical protein
MYDQMTTEALQAEQTHLHTEGKALKRKRRDLDAELQRRAIAASAGRKLDQMSPAERAAAAQMIGQVGAIASGESIGTPGAR